MTRRHVIFAATLIAALAILIVVATHVDWVATFAQIRRIGISGAALMLADLAVAVTGPMLAWHVLMRADGIKVDLSTTLLSGVMGHSTNLISPLMYFGGEGVRTLHIASAMNVPRRRVLATVVAAEFQQLTALTATLVAALIVVAGSARSDAMPITWMATGAATLAAITGAIFLVLLMDVRLLDRLIGLLMRCGIFPQLLGSVRQQAADVEDTLRRLLVKKKLHFLAAQLLSFISPLAQFVLPVIFFRLLDAVQPTLSQLASFFVLVQLLFMIPTTPAGLGVYEGGIIGVFRLHGWNLPDGAAYAILVRMDDVLFSVAGAVLLGRLGLSNYLKGTPDA